jgi:uncharacterized damage-inducible protein DinB
MCHSGDVPVAATLNGPEEGRSSGRYSVGMTRPLFADALDHHVWATVRLLEACEGLSAEQLSTTVPGTFGSIVETLRHTVGADSWYLHRIGGDRYEPISDEAEAALDLAKMRVLMERHGAQWRELLDGDLDPERVVEVRREDGVFRAPIGVRLAQVVHHGTDHRSQVCTALSALGIEPPEIDVWAWGAAVGRTEETPATG